MKNQLNYYSARQSQLAQNIANADTPKYRSADIPKPDFQKLVDAGGTGPSAPLHMAITSPGHMGNRDNGSIPLKPMTRKSTYELNPNGNNVVIEEEIAQMAQNGADYQKALNLYGKITGLFRTAIGRPSGA